MTEPTKWKQHLEVNEKEFNSMKNINIVYIETLFLATDLIKIIKC